MVNSSSSTSNNRHLKELKISNPLSLSKFKPLMPRPSNIFPTAPMSPLSPPSFSCGCCFQTAGNNFARTPHLSNYGVNKRGIEPVVVSSCRWNPTREQLHALEDMYEKGMRTPTAEQIKQIATRLRRFGKIEGKNVFYWFQNHKARERQKRRRQMNLSHMHAHAETLQMKHSGLSNKKTKEEAEQTKQWATISGCSTICEDSESINKAAVTAESVREIGLTQYSTKGFHKQQTRINSYSRKASKYNLSFSSSSMPHYQNLFKELSGEKQILLDTWKPSTFPARNVENERRENIHTLELFPLGRGKTNGSREDSDFMINKTCTTPNKFFEFLPIMN